MTTLKLLRPLSCFSVLFTLENIAAASDSAFDIQSRFEVGLGHYEVQIGGTSQTFSTSTISTSSLKFSDTLPSVSAGLTILVDDFFFDVSTQQTFTGSFSDSSVITIETLDGGIRSTANSNFEMDFDRQEYSISVGYGISDSAVVFAGYRWSHSNLDDVTASDPIIVENRLDGSVITGIFTTVADYDYDYDGPSIGGAYQLNFDNRPFQGALVASVAVGFFDGELDVSSDTATIEINDGSELPAGSAEEIYETRGDTVGLRFGLGWRGLTSIENLSYSLDIDGYSYDFDAEDAGKADFAETVINVKAGLTYRF